MVERLQRALHILETLPSPIQETLAEQIERLAAPYLLSGGPPPRFAGMWADLPADMEETLETWRHESPPSPPYNEDP